MSRRRWLDLCMLISVGVAAYADPAPSPVTGGGEGLTLPAALEIALVDNPGLEEMRARAQAMAAIPSQAGSLPDPRLWFNVMNVPVDTMSLDQEAMTQLQLGVQQEFPFPGKRGLREEGARHEAEAAASSVGETRLRLVRDVRNTWWKLYYVDRALEVVLQNQRLMDQFVEVARTKYEVGQGLQQDVLLAQVEHSKLLDREIQLQGGRRNEVARLNALLNRSSQTPVRLPSQVESGLPDAPEESEVVLKAREIRPLLEERRNLVAAARSRLDLAKKDYYPDFKVGAAYGFRQGSNPDGSSRDDFVSAMLSMNLPLYAGRKQAKAVDQRQSELIRQQHALNDAYLRVQADIAQALADYRRAREQAGLFKNGIIPQARQTVESMLAGYQVNQVDFLNLVRAQITLYNYEINYWRALIEANQARARLAASVGTETVHE